MIQTISKSSENHTQKSLTKNKMVSLADKEDVERHLSDSMLYEAQGDLNSGCTLESFGEL